jgi:putative Holliday junction resolvase
VCDPDRIIASAYGTHENGPANETYFRNLFGQNKFVGIVVGLPLHANGEESDMSQRARTFAAWLSTLTGVPFVMWDERYSSSAAESLMSEAKVHWKKRKGKVDRIAAQMILQSFIDVRGWTQGGNSDGG